MKLASEIAAKVGHLQYGQDKDAAWLALTEAIIAARLEPVRKAVKLGLGIAQEQDSEWDYTEEIQILQSALAMLSVKSDRVAVKVLTNTKVRCIVGATRTRDGNVTRIKFDRPIHVEQGEDLEIKAG